MKIKVNIYIILLILIGLIPLIDLFHPGLPITHDGQDHVARIANFYQNLSEGNLIPRWAANLNWGFGHPILMFLYPLPSYATSLFHFLGFSLVDSLKIVFGLAFILSGIFMYLWLRNFLNEEAAVLGGLLYMFTPYRFVDLYVRGAIGEHLAFVFLPLILYFLLNMTKGKNSSLLIVGGSLSIAGLILSHNAISLMFLPLIFLYIIYLLWHSKSYEFLFRILFLIILGLGISSFFWIPAFFEGKYTLRDIVTAKDYASRFVNFKDLIFGEWNYGITGQFSVQVGVLHWLVSLLGLPLSFLLYKKRNKLWVLSLGSFIVFWLTLFLMHSSSKFIWDSVTTLQKFQFPWRFLSVTVFVASVIGSILIYKAKNYKKFVVILITAVLLFLNKDYWHAKDYLIKPKSFFTGIYNSTTDTGESSPIWSVRFMEKRPKSEIEVIEGKATINKLSRASTKHEYEIIGNTKVRIKENTLYFPGWKVLIDGKRGNIEFQDPSNRGLITFYVEKGNHNIKLIFEETKLRTFANLISAISLIGLLFLWKSKLIQSY